MRHPGARAMSSRMAAAIPRTIELGFADAVTILMRACQIDGGRRQAFVARVRHLQRLGLPPRQVTVGQPRLTFGLAELAAIATAIQLMAAFLPPTVAVRYVLERWTELTPCLLAGAVGELPTAYADRRPIEAGRFLVLAGSALCDLGDSAAHEARYAFTLGPVRSFGDGSLAQAAVAADGSGTLVDTGLYMPLILTCMRDLGNATDEDIAAELDRLRFSTEVPAA